MLSCSAALSIEPSQCSALDRRFAAAFEWFGEQLAKHYYRPSAARQPRSNLRSLPGLRGIEPRSRVPARSLGIALEFADKFLEAPDLSAIAEPFICLHSIWRTLLGRKASYFRRNRYFN